MIDCFSQQPIIYFWGWENTGLHKRKLNINIYDVSIALNPNQYPIKMTTSTQKILFKRPPFATTKIHWVKRSSLATTVVKSCFDYCCSAAPMTTAAATVTGSQHHNHRSKNEGHFVPTDRWCLQTRLFYKKTCFNSNIYYKLI